MSHHMCVYFCSSNYNGVGSLFSFLRLLRQNVPSEDRTASKQLLRHLRRRKSQNFKLACAPTFLRQGGSPSSTCSPHKPPGSLPVAAGTKEVSCGRLQSPSKTNGGSMNAFPNDCLLTPALGHGKPPHADCAFGDNVTSIFTRIRHSRLILSNLGSLGSDRCKLQPKKTVPLDHDGRSSSLKASGVEFSFNILFSSSRWVVMFY